ncbi:hypothetical protein A3731_11635 [Roseovarius sp. HI0049]|nr:hypothetical protein A3731_36605 [Roseovarius sp. HI0049]KZY42013.1 hypothetical protein A3731_11635 [Roseovarius sp. HI0049]
MYHWFFPIPTKIAADLSASRIKSETWRTGRQLIFDISHRRKRFALFRRAARGGGESDERFFTQTVQFRRAQRCCFKSRDKFHVILLWLQGGSEPLRAFRLAPIIIGQ